jgi:hypothetical protein
MFTTTMLLSLLLGDDPIAVSFKHETDHATVRVDDQQTVVVIESKSGIGSAMLSPGQSGWPKTLELSLSLKALEGFTLSSRDLRVRTFLGDTKPEAFRRRDDQWEPVELDAKLAPRIRQIKDRIQIELPARWLDTDSKELTIDWVDYYR